MNRSILSVCMLTLLCLLSCDINALNELLDKAREKFLDESKDNKDLNHKQENQEQKEVVIDDLEEEVKIQQDIEVKPVNSGFVSSQQVYPYYVQEEREIKEEDLTPSTDEEKKAQAEIDNVKRALVDSGCSQLIEDALKLKSECELLESRFYDTLSELKNKIQNKTGSSYLVKDKTKRQQLIQLCNQLNDQRSQIDMLRIKVDNGLDERRSAEFFFNKSQETLREAITERLRKKKRRSYLSRRVNSGFLAQKSRSEAENVLSLLESSSSDIGEAIGIKKEIEKLIEEAKSYLSNLAR